MPKLDNNNRTSAVSETKYCTFANKKTWPVKDDYVEALISVDLSDFTEIDCALKEVA